MFKNFAATTHNGKLVTYGYLYYFLKLSIVCTLKGMSHGTLESPTRFVSGSYTCSSIEYICSRGLPFVSVLRYHYLDSLAWVGSLQK